MIDDRLTYEYSFLFLYLLIYTYLFYFLFCYTYTYQFSLLYWDIILSIGSKSIIDTIIDRKMDRLSSSGLRLHQRARIRSLPYVSHGDTWLFSLSRMPRGIQIFSGICWNISNFFFTDGTLEKGKDVSAVDIVNEGIGVEKNRMILKISWPQIKVFLNRLL